MRYLAAARFGIVNDRAPTATIARVFGVPPEMVEEWEQTIPVDPDFPEGWRVGWSDALKGTTLRLLMERSGSWYRQQAVKEAAKAASATMSKS
ncbi:MAG: hypothetical protein JNK11_07065 [Alphaproteobacteria bacterium]|nr:hypothetical protein [Alphaproteobacteria bacterium]